MGQPASLFLHMMVASPSHLSLPPNVGDSPTPAAQLPFQRRGGVESLVKTAPPPGPFRNAISSKQARGLGESPPPGARPAPSSSGQAFPGTRVD
jgi:hypothetical protein